MVLELKIHVPDNLVIDDEQKAGQGMAEAVRDCIRLHLIDKGLHTAPNRNGLPPSGYWRKAANTVKVEVQQGLHAVVAAGAESNDPKAPGQGIALHYEGGTVYPKKKALAIPISPIVAGIWPSEAGAWANEDEYSVFWPKNSSHGFIKDNERNNGFKNFYGNFDSACGIDYTVDVTKPEGQKVNILKMSNGQPFDTTKMYKVAINSYRGNGGGELLTKGAGIPKEELKSRILSQTELGLRHYLAEEIQKQGSVNPKPNNNWRFIPENLVAPAIQRDRELLFGKK